MQAVEQTLALRLRTALVAAFGADYHEWDPHLRAATRPEFGHFQTNLPLRLAGPAALPAHQVAERLLARLRVDDLCLPPVPAGRGFINLTLRPEFLAAQVNTLLTDDRLGVTPAALPQRIVVDFSSPNVAKEMHVGHLRSTVIGDTLARVLAFVGHDVVRQNHLGDWGTQFGMLIEELLDSGHDGGDLDLRALGALYRRARARFDGDDAFAYRARSRLVALQAGDERTVGIWRRLVAVSLSAFDETYTRLGTQLTDADVAGESSYHDDLPRVVADLAEAGLLTESDGALCAFPPGFTTRDGTPLPLIVRKADGGFGYDATDLAAIRHRIDSLRADRLVYVVDTRQSLHFDQVFALARVAGWLPERVTARHVAFGMVLGADGKPFKTRSGDTVSLASLLDAAEAKAAALLDERGSALAEPARSAAARAIGIGAVKYADLANDLGRDYVFALDRMVALTGNTGPYLQYAHARLASLLDRAGGAPGRVTVLERDAEQRLALLLTGFAGAVETVASTLEPHRLCGYLYQVATASSVFYEQCPVLRAEGDVRTSRLALCLATRRVLATGLDLLGITALTRM
ncbi:arginine--tRNA ligase [Planosporangium sp. 12N6]|uniref:arginine--tRNA ligase n=1 Tax=Planosporangium spinosum TaxID=3402278 RepID=UPI003CF0C16C